METNVRKHTYERTAGGLGTIAAQKTPEQQLERIALNLLLFENQAYQTGQEIAQKVFELTNLVSPEFLVQLVEKTKFEYRLRHAPLWMIIAMTKNKNYRPFIRSLVEKVITRPDDITELLSLYWLINGTNAPIANSIKRGLADAFKKFSKYQLAKWQEKKKKIKLADAIKLLHPKPTEEQGEIFKEIIENKVKPPDTWEVAFSRGENKKDVFERLIQQNKLPVQATIMNLRKMLEVGVDKNLIFQYLEKSSVSQLLPSVLLSAILSVEDDDFIHLLEKKLLEQADYKNKLRGETAIILDVSGSMRTKLSRYSNLTYLSVGFWIAWILVNISEEYRIWATSGNDINCIHDTREINLDESYKKTFTDFLEVWRTIFEGGGIFTRQAVEYVSNFYTEKKPQRLIVITDSQDCDRFNDEKPKPFGNLNIIVNISSHTVGIAFDGVWDAEINGLSFRIIQAIRELDIMYQN